jgi:hypothetical protein
VPTQRLANLPKIQGAMMLYKPPDTLELLFNDIQWLIWCGDEAYAQKLLIEFAEDNIKDVSYVEEEKKESSKKIKPQGQTRNDSVGGNDARK